MVQIYKNANRNRIGIFIVSFIVAIVGWFQYKTVGSLALINVVLGGSLAILEFIDILILHSKKFRNVIKKLPIVRSLKSYEIRVAEDYLLCGKGSIQIVTDNSISMKNAMLFLLPDGNGNMIHGRYYVSSTEKKVYVYTDCKIETINQERALLKII